MASAPHIFISYSHIDNEPLVEDQKGWVTVFHEVLEKRLGHLLGERPQIWRDTELRGNSYFDDEIAKNFEGARIFISVITPRYLKSDYCQKELSEYIQSTERLSGLRVGERSRVIKVIKTPVALEEQPEVIQGLLGYQFYHIEPERRRLREFALHAPIADHRDKFLIVLDDLAQDVDEVLKLIERGIAGSEAPVEGQGNRVVFLAPTTSDVKEPYDQIRRELLESGVTVLPDELPFEAEAFEDKVRSDLARADLSIHIVGGRYGFVPEGGVASIVQLQLDLAAGKDGLDRLIWMPPDLLEVDPRQQTILNILREDPSAQRNAQLLETTVEGLRTAIAEWLRPQCQEHQRVEKEEHGPPWVYLIYDPRDEEQMAPLEEHLWNCGFEVRTPLPADEETDESEVRKDHEENLRLCDAFIVLYGTATEGWLRKKISDLRRARGLGRTRPILATAVYVGSPRSPRKDRFRSNEALIIQASGDFDAEQLQPMIASIKQRMAGG